MLIITRQVGEAIMISHDIIVRVLEIKGTSIRIGIDAPRSVPVHRQEVYEQIQRQGEANKEG